LRKTGTGQDRRAGAWYKTDGKEVMLVKSTIAACHVTSLISFKYKFSKPKTPFFANCRETI